MKYTFAELMEAGERRTAQAIDPLRDDAGKALKQRACD